MLASQKAREIIANKKANEIFKIYPLVQTAEFHADAVVPAALVVPSGQGKHPPKIHHSLALQSEQTREAAAEQAVVDVVAVNEFLAVPSGQLLQVPEVVALQYSYSLQA
jgi:hypothetical protein